MNVDIIFNELLSLGHRREDRSNFCKCRMAGWVRQKRRWLRTAETLYTLGPLQRASSRKRRKRALWVINKHSHFGRRAMPSTMPKWGRYFMPLAKILLSRPVLFCGKQCGKKVSAESPGAGAKALPY